ncbi:hypothetical protein MIR68_007932 [Amoeboaphelidium protococcarum]|nr:hypothetical protein MIR68_007932 [Amoeboaphelidium protococcarum]
MTTGPFGNNNMNQFASPSNNYQGGNGGFLSQGNNYDSPSVQANAGQKRAQQSLRPVTILQIMDTAYSANPESPLELDGRELSVVSLVGCVRKAQEATASIQYTIEDGTGSAEVRLYDNKANEALLGVREILPENTYVYVMGSVRMVNGKRLVNAMKVQPIVDHNQITFHYLEAIATHLKITRGQPMGGIGGQQPLQFNNASAAGNPYSAPQQQQQSSVNQNSTYSNNNNNQSGGGSFNDGLTPIQRKIIEIVRGQTSAGDKGVHINQIAALLTRQNVQGVDINREIETMVQDGHLYSTIDDFHVQWTG